jgi:hypothetical protein
LRVEQEHSASRNVLVVKTARAEQNNVRCCFKPWQHKIWSTDRNAAGQNYLLRGIFESEKHPTTAPFVKPNIFASRLRSCNRWTYIRGPHCRRTRSSCNRAYTRTRPVKPPTTGPHSRLLWSNKFWRRRGLCPDLQPGDCIVASGIVDFQTLWPTDPLWSSKLLDNPNGTSRNGGAVAPDSTTKKSFTRARARSQWTWNLRRCASGRNTRYSIRGTSSRN